MKRLPETVFGIVGIEMPLRIGALGVSTMVIGKGGDVEYNRMRAVSGSRWGGGFGVEEK